MVKHKSNGTDIKFFILPFLGLFIVFGFVTYTNVEKRTNEILNVTEESAINMADTYATVLLNAKESFDIVEKLIDEKIVVASKAVLLLDEATDNLSLTDLAERLQVDQISIYNEQAEIVYSTEEEFVGWRAYEGHPVYTFINGNQATLVESIRQDTINMKYYKFGYVKRNDNTFVQIGVNADNINSFTSKFDTQRAIEEIVTKKNVKQAYFIDNNFQIVASSIPEYNGSTMNDLPFKAHIQSSKTATQRSTFNGDEVFYACAPVSSNDEWLGTLLIVWDTDLFNLEIKQILVSGLQELSLILLIIGATLYFAYRKNQSNVMIAYYDRLTGLPNTVYMEEYLSDVIKKKRKNEHVAVLLLNCTNFKMINATYGFKYGDAILKQIADEVKNILPANSMFFKFDADRFILVVEDYQTQEKLIALSQRIIDTCENSFNGEGKHKRVDAKISIYEIEDCNVTVDRILQDTTLAINHLINNPYTSIIFFEKDMDIDLRRKDLIENTLRDVISGKNKESFYLEFQPKLDTHSNKINGFEALARMTIDSLGQVSPLEFIEIAEQRLLIHHLGKYIIKLAFDFIKELEDNGLELTVAINISLIQLLRSEFLDELTLWIKESGVRPSMVEFEITESVFLDNFEIINQKLKEMKQVGVSIALDDFGTGFSSFARLRELEIDTVKIDQYFISKISTLNEKHLLTDDIISMSHKLGLTVVAEGVENEEQRNYLEKHECDILQGYLISKPLKHDKAMDYLRHTKGSNIK